MDLDGYAAAHGGTDLREMPLSRFLNYVWWYFTRNAEKKDRDKFESQVFMPPRGVVPVKGPWTAEAETQGFQSLRAALNK